MGPPLPPCGNVGVGWVDVVWSGSGRRREDREKEAMERERGREERELERK